jgi:hypothetical protein
VADTIPCRGCRTLLNLSDSGCPVCLRGRSPQEITRGFAHAREEKARRRRRPFVVIATLAAVGGAGYALNAHKAPILDAGRRAWAWFGHFYDENSDPAYTAPNIKHMDEPPAATATSAPPSSNAAPLTATQLEPARAAASGGLPTPVLSAPEPLLPHAEPTQWILHGRVYDLATLKPLAGVLVSAKLGDSILQERFTDPNGYYAFVLGRPQTDNGGYSLETRNPHYATAAQYEGDIPYRTLPAEDRQRMIEAAQDNGVQSTPLRDVQGEEGVLRDVFLSPRR